MASLRAGAEDGQFCALDLFKSSVSPVGASEVSCQARPALSSFGIFVPRRLFIFVNAGSGSVFPLAPAPGVSGDHTGNVPVVRALLAAVGTDQP
jgi:hypothetical protein